MKKPDTKIAQYHLHKAHPEKLQFELYDLNAYRKKSGGQAAKAHSHSYYQIIWFFDEGGTHVVDFQTFDIRKNTILFIAKDQIHAFDANLEVNGWLIHFNESFFMHSDVDIFLKYNIFNSQQNPCYAIDSETAKIGTFYISLIAGELTQKHRFGHGEIIRFLLKAFLINFERVHLGNTEKNLEINSQYELQFYKLKELVEYNYAKGLSVIDYADMLNISARTLTTITKAHANKSTSKLISERVILEAKRLLKFTTLQVGEVAYKTGFDDASYFVKYFKRHVGSSPSAYRNAQSPE